mmetsp:Transcript_11400/g.15960  ORF Transcript_11400/g.15960 Transcript_11400/m.15960 type:complete len:196 (+) Transcript_11400:121-708(+)
MSFKFYPWGNAYYNTSKCGTATYDKTDSMYCWIDECGSPNATSECFDSKVSPILCQHGQNECLGNRIEACANGLANITTDSVQFAVCFEGLYNETWFEDTRPILDSAQLCLSKTMAYVNPVMFGACLEGPEGDRFDMLNAMATARYGSSREGTPWVVVNGKVLTDVNDLLQAVCDAHDGEKPGGCAEISDVFSLS